MYLPPLWLNSSQKYTVLHKPHNYINSAKEKQTIFITEKDKAEYKEKTRSVTMTRKKQERQSIAENIEIDMPSGEDAKEIAIIYRSHGGMAFERLFRPDDSLKSIYTWLCAEVEADILPPKFSLGCSDPASCTAGGCKHTYPLTAEIANRSGIGSLPEVLFIKQEEFTGNDTLTGYDNVLFA
ncbi:hypothetical protein KP79_PYT20366 [Mizuhopecten yessoensis]|uniref:UBX domain-containing protein n=1 Tax=Mizuhopecten yessoensis TaxID=6573 RepID=A0A210QGP2_MIZYE|nr:hypothetical protein KP79_PYT20366 [Mizuhopecten yessoensis]